MEISQFKSDQDTGAKRLTLTWEELCSSLCKRAPAAMPKDELPMWSPAVFRGDARAVANVEAVSCLVFDVDESPVPTLRDLETALAGKVWFAHSSSGATADAPRWRLLLAVSRPMTAEEHGLAWRAVAERLPFRVGAASKDASRCWYAPRAGSDESYVTGGC